MMKGQHRITGEVGARAGGQDSLHQLILSGRRHLIEAVNAPCDSLETSSLGELAQFNRGDAKLVGIGVVT